MLTRNFCCKIFAQPRKPFCTDESTEDTLRHDNLPQEKANRTRQKSALNLRMSSTILLRETCTSKITTSKTKAAKLAQKGSLHSPAVVPGTDWLRRYRLAWGWKRCLPLRRVPPRWAWGPKCPTPLEACWQSGYLSASPPGPKKTRERNGQSVMMRTKPQVKWLGCIWWRIVRWLMYSPYFLRATMLPCASYRRYYKGADQSDELLSYLVCTIEPRTATLCAAKGDG